MNSPFLWVYKPPRMGSCGIGSTLKLRIFQGHLPPAAFANAANQALCGSTAVGRDLGYGVQSRGCFRIGPHSVSQISTGSFGDLHSPLEALDARKFGIECGKQGDTTWWYWGWNYSMIVETSKGSIKMLTLAFAKPHDHWQRVIEFKNDFESYVGGSQLNGQGSLSSLIPGWHYAPEVIALWWKQIRRVLALLGLKMAHCSCKEGPNMLFAAPYLLLNFPMFCWYPSFGGSCPHCLNQVASCTS